MKRRVEQQRAGKLAMHYPRRNSRIKRLRKQGFRARMRSAGGRRIIRRQRTKGRHKIGLAD